MQLLIAAEQSFNKPINFEQQSYSEAGALLVKRYLERRLIAERPIVEICWDSPEETRRRLYGMVEAKWQDEATRSEMKELYDALLCVDNDNPDMTARVPSRFTDDRGTYAGFLGHLAFAKAARKKYC
jgi:hypothetical protein